MQASYGLALIELVVVTVIANVLIGLAVLSTGSASTSRELDNEAERLTGLTGVLTDEAVLDNCECSLRLEYDVYQMPCYDKARTHWLPVAHDSHHLPEWTGLIFESDGQPLVLIGSKGKREREKGTDQPQLSILSSGELSPLRLRLAKREPKGRALSLSSNGFRLSRAEMARR